jgi:hypothetical protein
MGVISKRTELQRMMVVSNAFVDITNFKNESVLRYSPELLIAATVNSAFSIEVALKFLYYDLYDKKILNEHSIKKLYEKIKDYGLEKYLLNDFTQEELNTILEQIDYAFVNFRYIYEYQNSLKITPSLLKDFTLFINCYCNNYYEQKYCNT